MSEADERLLERIRYEVAMAVGPRIAVLAVRQAITPSGVKLVADCETPLGSWQIDADGGTLVDATGHLIERATQERLIVAFREVATA